jgi:non-ribosomal peptide synthetase component F
MCFNLGSSMGCKGTETAAVIDEHATITYGVLDERANRWVGALQAACVTPGDGVMLMLWFIKEIPLNAAGKADRLELAQRLARSSVNG